MTAVYFCEAAGFLLQFLPCAVLCFIPFERDRLRLSPAKLYPALALTAIVASALFPLLLYGVHWGSYVEYSMAANMYMLAVIALYLAAYIFLVRGSLVKKFLVIYVVLLYAAAVYWLIGNVVPSMGSAWNNGFYTYSPYIAIFLVALQLPLFPLLYLFMRRKVGVFLREIGTEHARAEFRFASISTAAFLALMMVVDSMRISTLFFLFLVLNQALICWMLFSDAVLRHREETALRALEAQRLQYENITSDMARSARQRHDMRHHYNYMYTLAKGGSTDELTEYLSSLVAQTEFRENEVFCSDPTVNALLQYYVGRARDENIVCDIAADCADLQISPEDLTVLIGNVLENAIAASKAVPGGGHIDAAVGLVHGALTLVVTNSCQGVRLAPGYSSDSGYLPAAAFLSSRSGGGRGLESVDAVAKKYGGSAAFKYDKTSRAFTSRVILNHV